MTKDDFSFYYPELQVCKYIFAVTIRSIPIVGLRPSGNDASILQPSLFGVLLDGSLEMGDGLGHRDK